MPIIPLFFLRRECMWLINQKEMTHFHTHGRAHKCRLRCLHIWSSGRLLVAYLSFTYNWIKPYSHSEYWWLKYALVNVSEEREGLLCCVLSASVGYVCSLDCVCVCREGLAPKKNWPQTNPLARGVLKQVTYPVTDGLCCVALSNIFSQRERRVRFIVIEFSGKTRVCWWPCVLMKDRESDGGDKKGEDDGVSVWNQKRSHTASLELFLVFLGSWWGGQRTWHITSVVHALNKEEHLLSPRESLAPVGVSTNLRQLQGTAVVRQSRVAVWYVIYTVAGSSLGVIHN